MPTVKALRSGIYQDFGVRRRIRSASRPSITITQNVPSKRARRVVNASFKEKGSTKRKSKIQIDAIDALIIIRYVKIKIPSLKVLSTIFYHNRRNFASSKK